MGRGCWGAEEAGARTWTFCAVEFRLRRRSQGQTLRLTTIRLPSWNFCCFFIQRWALRVKLHKGKRSIQYFSCVILRWILLSELDGHATDFDCWWLIHRRAELTWNLWQVQLSKSKKQNKTWTLKTHPWDCRGAIGIVTVNWLLEEVHEIVFLKNLLTHCIF